MSRVNVFPIYASSYGDYKQGSGPVKLSRVRKKPPLQQSSNESNHNSDAAKTRERLHEQNVSKSSETLHRGISLSDTPQGSPQEKQREPGSWWQDKASQSQAVHGAGKDKKSKRWSRQDPEKELERAKLSAAGSLSLRMHCREELRNKLITKGYDSDITEQALDRMEELDMLNDPHYAQTYARSKWNQSKWSPSKISFELSRKGISSATVREAVKTVFGHSSGGVRIDDPSAEGYASDDDCGDALQGLDSQLVETISRRLESMQNLPKETQIRRVVGWMQRRGHRWDVVSSVLRELGLLS